MNSCRGTRAILRDATGVGRFVLMHPANDGQRLRALVRSVAYIARGKLAGRSTLAYLANTIPMEAHVGFANASRVVYAHTPDWNQLRCWARELRPGANFIDVGANVGTYSLWAAHHGSVVQAVEPDPAVLPLLCRNLSLNPDLNIQLVEGALSDRVGNARVVLRTGGKSSLAVDGQGFEVRSLTLDDLIGERAIDGVKIDVEGFERLVLQGASQALADRRIALLQLEWNNASERALGETRRPVAQLLESFGYGFFRPNEEGYLLPTSPDGYGSDIFAQRL